MNIRKLRERIALWILPSMKTEVRFNDDGTTDEVVGYGFLHVEQMDTNKYWAALYLLGGDERITMWWQSRDKLTLDAGWDI